MIICLALQFTCLRPRKFEEITQNFQLLLLLLNTQKDSNELIAATLCKNIPVFKYSSIHCLEEPRYQRANEQAEAQGIVAMLTSGVQCRCVFSFRPIALFE